MVYLFVMYEVFFVLFRLRVKVCLRVFGEDCNDVDYGKTLFFSYNIIKNVRVKVSVCVLCYSVGSKSIIYSVLRSERLLVF